MPIVSQDTSSDDGSGLFGKDSPMEYSQPQTRTSSRFHKTNFYSSYSNLEKWAPHRIWAKRDSDKSAPIEEGAVEDT
jgi:hypothetical protein